MGFYEFISGPLGSNVASTSDRAVIRRMRMNYSQWLHITTTAAPPVISCSSERWLVVSEASHGITGVLSNSSYFRLSTQLVPSKHTLRVWHTDEGYVQVIWEKQGRKFLLNPNEKNTIKFIVCLKLWLPSYQSSGDISTLGILMQSHFEL